VSAGPPWAALLAALLLLAAGCADDPDDDDIAGDDDTDGDDDTGGDDDSYEGPWEDPIEVLDTYEGGNFSELLEVRTWGDRIVFCSGVQGLQVYDAADPADLVFLDRISFSLGDAFYPRCQHLAVDAEGERIYVGSHADQIQPESFIAVIDASNPEQLVELQAQERSENVEGLAVAGDLLLVAVHDEGLLIFDRGEGGALVERARVDGLYNAWSVAVSGDLAYVPSAEGILSVVDISDPDAAFVAGSLAIGGAAKEVALDGDRAVVALGATGVALVSLAEPTEPVLIEIENTPGSALSVAIGADAVYVSDWNDVRVFDWTDRDDLVPVGHEPLDPSNASTSAESRTLGIAGRDDILFSSNWTEMVSYRYHADRLAPDLVISPQSLWMADAGPGEPASASMLLANHGTRPLAVQGVEGSQGITVGWTPEVVEAGQQGAISIVLEPDDDSTYLGSVEVRSDDPDQSTFSVLVRANGGGLGVGDPVGDMSFVALDGGVIHLADLAGSVVLLDYFATF